MALKRDNIQSAQTTANNNVLAVGGSGSGKTFRLVEPLINSEYASFVVTDPKMEITHHISEMMIASGYRTMCLNLYDEDGMKSSIHYNPWRYVKTETDVMELISIFMKSTGGSATGENAFWDQATAGVLEALGYYMMTEIPSEEHTFRTLMQLLDGCNYEKEIREVPSRGGGVEQKEVKIPGPTHRKMEKLKEKYWDEEAQTCTHNSYAKFMRFLDGSADVVSNTMASIEGRVKNLKVGAVLDLTATDDIDIPTIGAGVNYDGKTKTFLSIVTAEGSTTFNFLISMFYLQLWRQLYYYSDRFLNGRPLPIQVSAILDEFANSTFPDDFPSLLSTFRSRNCDATIILQDLQQLEKKYEKDFKSIKSNCSIFVFLGSNELDTCKTVSEELGHQTIAKRSATESQKGDSHNEDNIQRNVMDPEELMNLPKDKCVIRVQNEMPVVDLKTMTHLMPRYVQLCNGQYNPKPIVTPYLRPLDYDGVRCLKNHYIKSGQNVITLGFNDILALSDEEEDLFSLTEEELENNRIRYELEEQKEVERKQVYLKSLGVDGLRIMLTYKNFGYSEDQIRALWPLLQGNQYSETNIKGMFPPDMPVDEMLIYVEALSE